MNQTVGKLSTLVKQRTRRRSEQSAAVQRIETASFASFVASQREARAGEREVLNRSFEVDEDCCEGSERALLKAPRKKATEADELFVEALQVCPTLCAETGGDSGVG